MYGNEYIVIIKLGGHSAAALLAGLARNRKSTGSTGNNPSARVVRESTKTMGMSDMLVATVGSEDGRR